MKKLLAMLIVGGLLSMTTGCPPAGTTGKAPPASKDNKDKANENKDKANKDKADKDKADKDAGKNVDKKANLAKAEMKRKEATANREKIEKLKGEIAKEKDKDKVKAKEQEVTDLEAATKTLETDADKLEKENK